VFLKRGIESIFWANIFASTTSLLLLSPVIYSELKTGWPQLNIKLEKELILFAWPFVPSGLASLLVSVIDKPILVHLVGLADVGIYQANFKIGVFMMLIVSMFDQAWRPFFLAHAKEAQAPTLYARVFTFFTAFALWVLLGLIFLMPTIIQSNLLGSWHLIAPQYWRGLSVIPPVLLGYFFYGMYINFMVGPVITKKTRVLVWITLLGAFTSICTNLLLVPHVGIVGAGWAVACSYFMMASALFIFTQKNYPVPYQYKKVGCLLLLALLPTIAAYTQLQALAAKIALLCLYPIAATWIIKQK
jgi:O-antigen/teichoic acid export membrane protein